MKISLHFLAIALASLLSATLAQAQNLFVAGEAAAISTTSRRTEVAAPLHPD
jgi:hypothetical protein